MTIYYYGISKEITERREEKLHLKTPVSIGEIKKLLVDKYPGLESLSSMAIAVNEEYADDEMIVNDADSEIAVIPPVSGG